MNKNNIAEFNDAKRNKIEKIKLQIDILLEPDNLKNDLSKRNLYYLIRDGLEDMCLKKYGLISISGSMFEISRK